ncbi:fimbrial protein [Orbus mooreae]|uniref:fimbrial protein n=1 Tax=Orbus mooreae TaxID=3074107 RepID=UPI00370D8136
MYRFILITFSLLIISFNSNAESCTSPGNSFVFDLGVIKVDPSLSSGAKIGSEITLPTQPILNCTDIANNTSQLAYIGSTSSANIATYDGRFVYKTTIPGIGFAIGASIPNCSGDAWVDSGSAIQNVLACRSHSKPIGSTVYGIPKIQLYRLDEKLNTSSSVAKKLAGKLFVETLDSKGNSITYPDNYIYLTIAGAINSCAVKTKNVNVSLGTVKSSVFNGALTYSDAVGFKIQLDCINSVKASIQLDPTTSSVNERLGVLNITPLTDKATGIGIQILDSNQQPFPLERAVSLGSLSKDTNYIQFYARYMQIGNTITGGVANGALTFTVTYQ